MLPTARRSLPSTSKSLLPALMHAGRAAASIPLPIPHSQTQHSTQQTRPQNLHTTPRRTDFHFDTHHFVQRLEREGLNRQQAEGIMSAMAEVIDESIRNMTSNMVTKADQEKARPSRLYRRVLRSQLSPSPFPSLVICRSFFSITTHSRSTLPSSSPSFN